MNNIKSFDTGEIIGKFKPFVHCLQYDQFDKRCEACFKLNTNLLKCSLCKISKYCDRKCQKQLWKFHKFDCPLLKRNFNRYQSYPTFSFLLLRLMNKLKMDKNDNPSEIVFGQNRSLNDLISHKTKISCDAKKMSDFKILMSFLASNNAEDIFPPDEILEFFCKLVINTFTIVDNEFNSIGSGFYIGGSVFNHSCCSNAVAMFCGTELIVRALRKINMDEEITISYIEQMEPAHLRKQKLLNLYFFECLCKNCTDDALAREMTLLNCIMGEESYQYMDRSGTVFGNCKNHSPCNNISNTFEDVNSFLKILMGTDDADKLSSLFEELTMKCHVIAEQSNFYSYAYHDLAFEFCIKLKLWRQAIKHGDLKLKIFEKFFTGNHPSRAIHLAKLGKIAFNLNELQKATEYLEKSHDILVVTHGRDNEMTREVSQLVAECELEILRTNNY